MLQELATHNSLKALTNRLQSVPLTTIHTDQTASIKGRTINDNSRLLHDAINYVNEKNACHYLSRSDESLRSSLTHLPP